MKIIASIVCAALATCGTAQSGVFPNTGLLGIGFREARLSDFQKSSTFLLRRTDPGGFLAVSADFNGDGVTDEARILLNDDRQIAYVVATIMTTKLDTHVLETLPLNQAADRGLKAARPDGSHENEGLTIFSLGTDVARHYYFDGEKFQVVS